MNRSHTEIAGPSSRRIPRLIGMSFRSAIPGELHSCIARFRFADQNHSATNGAKCNRIQRKEVSPLAFVSMAGFSLPQHPISRGVPDFYTNLYEPATTFPLQPSAAMSGDDGKPERQSDYVGGTPGAAHVSENDHQIGR